MKEKILIITHNIENRILYERILERQGYVTKVLKNEDYVSEQSVEDCIGKMLKDVLNFHPQVIVCQYSSIVCSMSPMEFLLKVREALSQDEPPLNLIVLPWDGFPSRKYQFLVDEYLHGPIHPKSFLEIIEKMLASRK